VTVAILVLVSVCTVLLLGIYGAVDEVRKSLREMRRAADILPFRERT